jgi:hypothetical protein
MGSVGLDQIPPLYRSIEPDAMLEFHAARLLILLDVCGRRGAFTRRIDGRTKLAKLDFFLRYPQFLERAQSVLAARSEPHRSFEAVGPEREAPMIRYRFGPWDPRYRDFLAFLETRGLLRVVGQSTEGYSLTASGRRLAEEFAERPEFKAIVERATTMVGNLADWSGSALKDFIYEVFEREVTTLSSRQEIRPWA